MQKTFLSYDALTMFAKQLALKLSSLEVRARRIPVFAIPRGGIPAALAAGQFRDLRLVNDPREAAVFIDDIVDSGDTREKYRHRFPHVPFFALIDKTDPTPEMRGLGWVVFPWEVSNGEDEGIESNVTRLLEYVGENPARGGLLETPARVSKAWEFWCSGYNQKPEDVLKVFEDGGEKHDQMITVKDFPIYSHCEHHLAAIFGTCTISYIPNGKIVGLSKLPRLAAVFSRRLQVQERMTDQIADALFTHLAPLGVGVVIKARHMCMESRGVCQQGHHTVTTALRGVIKEQPLARAEFMRMV